MNEYYWSSLFDNYEPLKCKDCGKDLLEEGQGVVAFVEPLSSSGSERSVAAMYAACKGICDQVVRSEYRDMGYGTFWKDLEDLIHPQGFMSWDMALMDEPDGKGYYRVNYTPEARETLKEIKLKISQKVLRMPTPEERDKYLEDQRWRDLGPL